MSVTAKDKHQTYTANQRGEETVRETEARALLSCASRLETVRKPDCGRDDFVAAIQHNQQLWTLFQVCLCEPDNALPHGLKVLLLNVSRYVDKASLRAIGESNPDILRGLISINRNIAAGLSAGDKKDNPASTPKVPSPDMPSSVITTA
ncbi:MAG: flagellar biosynthesis regulator FlaF [Alphaproteobacteria bacterium]|nr:flagellar biosynthesis regulator FlaF [Alphaproteobacteria bacterium]